MVYSDIHTCTIKKIINKCKKKESTASFHPITWRFLLENHCDHDVSAFLSESKYEVLLPQDNDSPQPYQSHSSHWACKTWLVRTEIYPKCQHAREFEDSTTGKRSQFMLIMC